MLNDRCVDGGIFFPRDIPELSRDSIISMGKLRTNACIAGLYNLLSDSAITEWDLDFSVGRQPVRFRSLDRKTMLLEGWHNPEGRLSYLTKFLADRISPDSRPGFWLRVAADISVLGTGICSLLAQGAIDWAHPVDISVISGDFSAPLSGWYLQSMGFPVGKIICCCNENQAVWELIHLGQLRTEGVCTRTGTPEADILIPAGLEVMIAHYGSAQDIADFSQCLLDGGTYIPSEQIVNQLRNHLFVSVVSESRMRFTIAGIMQRCFFPISPYGALCYAGAQDYRTKRVENNLTMVFSEKSPKLDRDMVSSALGISSEALEKILNRM